MATIELCEYQPTNAIMFKLFNATAPLLEIFRTKGATVTEVEPDFCLLDFPNNDVELLVMVELIKST